ncbi:MAG: PQQ-binding-like beta-propeller repeat protein [Fuerstiella sp.]
MIARSIICIAIFLVALLNSSIPTSSLQADDWPQILGPARDGIANGESLLPRWPAGGPEELWTRPVGEGFAGVAVKGNSVILFHRKGNEEIVDALTADTGKAQWTSSSTCSYRGGISSDTGPRCVPLVTDNRVVVYGVEGMLRCLNFADGKEIWERDTWTDFGAPEGYFGAGSTPVVVGDKVIVNVGGRTNAAVVAFSLETGKTLWQNFDDTASYSSPVAASIDGTEHVFVVTRLNVVSLNPADGSLRFQFPFGMRGPTVNGATPVVVKDHLFVSSSYRVGSVWAKISDASSLNVASGEDLLATQYATPIKYKDVLFAVDGRQDSGTATIKCIDPIAQKVLWKRGDFDYGTMLRVNDDLLFLSCGGELIRLSADLQKYQEIHRSTVLADTPQGYRLPAISNGRLFVRDNDVLKCLRVGKTVVAK